MMEAPQLNATGIQVGLKAVTQEKMTRNSLE